MYNAEVAATMFDNGTNGDVTANAGDELIETHLDRLRELVVVPREALDRFFYLLTHVFFRLVSHLRC